MPLDETLLREARHARDRAIDRQNEADRAQVGYQRAIRRLHAAGGSLREIADALGMSYQRVHQVVDTASGKGALKPSRKAAGACAFCGAAPQASGGLVHGPGTRICDRCIDLACEVLATGEQRADGRTTIAAVDAGQGPTRCGFCGRRRDDAPGGIAEAPGRPSPTSAKFRARGGPRICGDCLVLAGEILAQGATAPA